MKIVAFRPPGFADNPLVGVPAFELSDLDEKTLGRVVDEMRHRIMIRDTMLTIERLYWSTSVSQACWMAILTAAVEELHGRALADHMAWRGRKLAEATKYATATRAALGEDPQIGHYAHATIEALVRGDGQLDVYGGPAVTSLVDSSQADNALASERCEAAGRTKLMNTPVRCQGATGHAGQHFNGPRVARTWWA